MRVCVVGLWHLGSVVAASLAAAGHDVVGYDGDAGTTARLGRGEPPILEPGLAELVRRGVDAGTLRFTSDPADALRGVDVVWVTHDTPVDEDDHADVAYVTGSVAALFTLVPDGALVLISSQLPVGSTRRLEQVLALSASGPRGISFGYSPENLRLGKAIGTFTHPDRVVVGLRRHADRERVERLLTPMAARIEWMSVESAEMTKHALNAFLATSVAFINEIASICEHVGADAKEVERGLKSDKRIGPGAYLSPGGAFAGGTLARDVVFLSNAGRAAGVPTHLIDGVKSSNDAHRGWAGRRLREILGDVDGRRIAVWGLTYKSGTDTLRRSSAVELCRSLVAQGASVSAYDPVVKFLPDSLAAVDLRDSALGAAKDAVALVVMTEWPEYKDLEAAAIAAALSGNRIVLDANRFLAHRLASHPHIVYVTVGTPV